ncbi:hypothetical protein FACS189467_5020 [Bacteroidia bacterium]|nr:hypothetical protein FACS189467_5020 [Bacteroidia bacterium]
MKTLKVLVVFAALCCIVGAVYAQKPARTAYEKRMIELVLQLSEKSEYLAPSERQALQPLNANRAQLEYASTAYLVELFDMVIVMVKLMDAGSGKAAERKIAQWFLAELKKAEALKTNVDRTREKQREAEQAKRAAENKKKQKEEELQEELQKQQKLFAQSDKGRIQKRIQELFAKWMQKSEYETQNAYDERLQSKSQEEFLRVCSEVVREIIDRKSYEQNFETRSLVYNADAEQFTITFKIGSNEKKGYINVTVDKAPAFKENWRTERVKNYYDWVFVGNELYPAVVNLRNKTDENYSFNFSWDKQNEVIITYDDLGINNPYSKGSAYKLSDAKELALQEEAKQKEFARQEQERQKEFARQKQERQKVIDMYNNKLDSTYREYNSVVLKNPYNVNNSTLNAPKQLDNYETIQQDYESASRDLSDNYQQKIQEVEKYCKQNRPEKYASVYYLKNPDKKAEGDKNYVECSCNYDRRSDYDIDFIDNKLGGKCDCRERMLQKYAEYFPDRAIFDALYPDENEVQKAAQKVLCNNNFEIVKKTHIDFIRQTDFSGLRYYGKSQDMIKTLAAFDDCEIYYDVIAFIIETNKDLRSEWNKNGKYFENQKRFWESYTGSNKPEYSLYVRRLKENR